MINEIDLISGSEGISHNGIFRGKNLGSISNLNEYIAFRTAHGIDDKSYKDLYLGDYFVINDGTYNTDWIVAHFDYWYNKGNTGNIATRGVVLIPRGVCGESKMNPTENTTVGGYKASLAHTTTCPAIANALQTVFGSYLLNPGKLISNYVNVNANSMAGANHVGATTSWEWVQDRCCLPNEVQIFGCTVLSSSFYDVGEASEKLAVFNFISPETYGRSIYWLRSVVASTYFTVNAGFGHPSLMSATTDCKLRPLIYIG